MREHTFTYEITGEYAEAGKLYEMCDGTADYDEVRRLYGNLVSRLMAENNYFDLAIMRYDRLTGESECLATFTWDGKAY